MHISILGCGWLGLPLAQTLLGRGYIVKGSTTQEEKLATLEERGITPYLIRFSPQINDDYQADFFDSEVLIVNIPPKRNEEVIEVYPRQIASLLRAIERSPMKKVLFVSSTSVYPNVNRLVQESDTSENVKASGRALLDHRTNGAGATRVSKPPCCASVVCLAPTVIQVGSWLEKPCPAAGRCR